MDIRTLLKLSAQTAAFSTSMLLNSPDKRTCEKHFTRRNKSFQVLLFQLLAECVRFIIKKYNTVVWWWWHTHQGSLYYTQPANTSTLCSYKKKIFLQIIMGTLRQHIVLVVVLSQLLNLLEKK